MGLAKTGKTTIFRNGLVFTGEATLGRDTSPAKSGTVVAIKDDLITHVFSEDELQSSNLLNEEDTTVVDLKGRSLLPGLVDSHMHLLAYGSSLSRSDLGDCKNLDDIRKTISSVAAKNPESKRLLFRNWFQPTTAGKALASMIDDLDSRPIYIDSFDYHGVWCNTPAIIEMGLKDMPDPSGGEIARDEDGNPTGYLGELAVMNISMPFLAKAAHKEDNLISLRSAFKSYNDAGYTSVGELAMDDHSWQLLLELKDESTLRIAAYWLISPNESEEEVFGQIDKAISMRNLYNEATSPDLRIVGIKLMCDGTIDACTASLFKPYSHNSAQVQPVWTPSMLEKVVRKAESGGLQCAIHAIGDKAINLAINGLAAAGSPNSRHRIEHLEMSTSADAQRLGKLGILASVQPVHSDPHILTGWPKFLGPDRCNRAFAYGEYAEHGAHIAIGTDAPTASHMPFPNLYNATTRRSAVKPELPDKTTEHFKLSLFDAVVAATRGAAFAIKGDHRTGTIQVGKKADLAIVDMKWNPDDLLQARVCETWYSGNCIYRKA